MVAIADRSPARYNFELIGGNAERPACSSQGRESLNPDIVEIKMVLTSNLRGLARQRAEMAKIPMDARAAQRLDAMAGYVDDLPVDDERLWRLAVTLSFDQAGRDHQIHGENLRREFARFGYAPDHLDSFDRFLDRLVLAARRDVTEAAP
jgi:hypothetical protein